MRPDDIDFRNPRRQAQLRQIRAAVKTLEERTCACGCDMQFRVMPSSPHVHASLGCAARCGWKRDNLSEADPEFRADRRWHLGVALAGERTMTA